MIKGFNLLLESIFILLLTIIIIFNLTISNTGNEYNNLPFIINDTLIILSKENTNDINHITNILNFTLENNYAFYIENILIIDKTHKNNINCIIRDENIFINANQQNNFKIKACH